MTPQIQFRPGCRGGRADIARTGVLVLHPSLPPKSVLELIAYAKNNPGKVTVASAGIGSAPHMYWELSGV